VYGQVVDLVQEWEAAMMRRFTSKVGIAGLAIGLGMSVGAIPAAAQSIPVVVNVPTAVVAMPVTPGVATPAIPGMVVGVPGFGGKGKGTFEREISRTKEKATVVIGE
jgi:hypothetical protein